MQAAILDRHIAIDPAICHGRPHIAGRRIRVQDIAIWHERLGYSVDEISADYDLALSEVYAALAYYFDHKAEIDQTIIADAALISSSQNSALSPLQAKLTKLRG